MDKEKEFSILIADDDEFNLKILTEILEPYYNVFSANSGAKAIQLSLTRQPDLILLDIVMPSINGFETLMELKNIDQTRRIPVIFITGLNSHQDEEKGLFLGAVDYIRKPFVNAIVKARVKTHLQIVKQMRTIEKEIMVDFLLDIPNRRYFDKQFQFFWRQTTALGSHISVMIIDVDDFKKVNDNYGHPHGDIVLQEIAKVLKNNLIDEDDVAARYGGEEFAVLLPNTDVFKAVVIGEEIRKSIEKLEVLCVERDEITKVTASVGVASACPCLNDLSQAELISCADQALYRAKNSGKNKVVY